jgi:hypothetical protein
MTLQMRELNVIMKGRFSPKELPPTISAAHLKRVVVRCGAVDERVLHVLKFLGELNISKLASALKRSYPFYFFAVWPNINIWGKSKWRNQETPC